MTASGAHAGEAHDPDAEQSRCPLGPGPWHRRALLALEIVLLAVAVGLRFLHLDADIPALQSADDLGDEGYWLLPARDLVLFGTFDADSNFVHGQAAAPLTVVTLAAIGGALGKFDYVLVRGFAAFYSSLILVLGLVYFDRLKRMPLAGVCFLALYGLFPVTLFYARIGLLEPHVLFYLFLSFVIVEHARSPRGMVVAGVVASIALVTKSVAVLVLPALPLYAMARHRTRAVVAAGAFLAGAAPIVIAYAMHLWINADRFAPTVHAVGSYHRHAGFLIDAASIDYFWLAPLVRPYVPWILAALAIHPVLRRVDADRTWMLAWLVTTLIALSVFRYHSYARHMLVLFPLILLTAFGFGLVHERVRRGTAALLSLVVVLGLGATVAASTYPIGRDVFLTPRYTYRDAARVLAAMTNEHDRVVGVHAHALSAPGRYRPKMRLNARDWRAVDPLERVDPTVALIATRFNGQERTGVWDRYFPRRAQFRHAERLDRLEYLDRRFAMSVYRVFDDDDEHRRFLRFRQGRPSRYDGLLYNLYASDLETGCMVKGALVAESRGDPEISHRKISPTGCAGMMGFCHPTAADPRFADLFRRLVPRVRSATSLDPAVFDADDRFVPEKALRAGGRYLGELRAQFASYSDAVKLVFAAYNGGPGFIASLVEHSGKPDPRWDGDLLPMLKTLAPEHASAYGRWSAAQRDHKLRVEIPQYVDDAFRTYDACIGDKQFLIPD